MGRGDSRVRRVEMFGARVLEVALAGLAAALFLQRFEATGILDHGLMERRLHQAEQLGQEVADVLVHRGDPHHHGGNEHREPVAASSSRVTPASTFSRITVAAMLSSPESPASTLSWM